LAGAGDNLRAACGMGSQQAMEAQQMKPGGIAVAARALGLTNLTSVLPLQFIEVLGLTLPQLCQNYMPPCVRIGKIDRLRSPLNAE
jgi:hypothetical protein